MYAARLLLASSAKPIAKWLVSDVNKSPTRDAIPSQAFPQRYEGRRTQQVE